jgi:hypothetical protein
MLKSLPHSQQRKCGENLGQMYEEVLQPKHFGAALASWRAIENDRSQRLLLQYAVAGPTVRFGRADIRGQQTQGAFSTESGPYAARFSCMIGVQQQGQFDDEEF